jgi:hypothetical protein
MLTDKAIRELCVFAVKLTVNVCEITAPDYCFFLFYSIFEQNEKKKVWLTK